MGEERAHRLAENEAIFREINENIEVQAQRFGEEQAWGFVCECSHLDCAQMINLTAREYEFVRERGETFVVLPGHEVGDIERVVEQANGYLIVEKTGAGREVARCCDPRAAPGIG